MRDLRENTANKTRRSKRRAMFVAMLIASSTTMADQPHGGLQLPPLPLNARAASDRVRQNPFCLPETPQGSIPVQLASGQSTDVRLKPIGTAVGLQSIHHPNKSETATIVIEESRPSQVRHNPLVGSLHHDNNMLVNTEVVDRSNAVSATSVKPQPTVQLTTSSAGSIPNTAHPQSIQTPAIQTPSIQTPSIQTPSKQDEGRPAETVSSGPAVPAQSGSTILLIPPAPKQPNVALDTPAPRVATPGNDSIMTLRPTSLPLPEPSQPVAGTAASTSAEPTVAGPATAPNLIHPVVPPSSTTVAEKPTRSPNSMPAPAGEPAPESLAEAVEDSEPFVFSMSDRSIANRSIADRSIANRSIEPVVIAPPGELAAPSEVPEEAPAQPAPSIGRFFTPKTVDVEPVVLEPVVLGPVVGDPAEMHPTAPEPVATTPVAPAMEPVASDPVVMNLADLKPAESKPAESKPAESNLAESKPAELNLAELNLAESNLAESNLAESNLAELDSNEDVAVSPQPTDLAIDQAKPHLPQSDEPQEGQAERNTIELSAVEPIVLDEFADSTLESIESVIEDQSEAPIAIYRAEPTVSRVDVSPQATLHTKRYRPPVAVKQVPIDFQRTEIKRDDTVLGAQVEAVAKPRLSSATRVGGKDISLTPLYMGRAKVRSLTLGGEVRGVKIEDESICQAYAAGPNQVKLIGTRTGVTRLVVWADTDEKSPTRMRAFEVHVSDSIEKTGNSIVEKATRLNRSIHEAFPTSDVVVRPHMGQLLVIGRCDGDAMAKQILRMVRTTCLVPVQDHLIVR